MDDTTGKVSMFLLPQYLRRILQEIQMFWRDVIWKGDFAIHGNSTAWYFWAQCFCTALWSNHLEVNTHILYPITYGTILFVYTLYKMKSLVQIDLANSKDFT